MRSKHKLLIALGRIMNPILVTCLMLTGWFWTVSSMVAAPPEDTTAKPRIIPDYFTNKLDLLGRWETIWITNNLVEKHNAGWGHRSAKQASKLAFVFFAYGSEKFFYGQLQVKPEGEDSPWEMAFYGDRIAVETNMIFVGGIECWWFRYQLLSTNIMRTEMVSVSSAVPRFACMLQRVRSIYPIVRYPMSFFPRIQGPRESWHNGILGESLAENYERLNRLVKSDGLKDLMGFYGHGEYDHYGTETREWYDPIEGIRIMDAMMSKLETKRDQFEDYKALNRDLLDFKMLLQRAASLNKKWNLGISWR